MLFNYDDIFGHSFHFLCSKIFLVNVFHLFSISSYSLLSELDTFVLILSWFMLSPTPFKYGKSS